MDDLTLISSFKLDDKEVVEEAEVEQDQVLHNKISKCHIHDFLVFVCRQRKLVISTLLDARYAVLGVVHRFDARIHQSEPERRVWHNSDDAKVVEWHLW